MNKNKNFVFKVSMTVLQHLGKGLYRNFSTVLGEVISNSWDADAENVYIYSNDDTNTIVIKDDGNGMTFDDFQNKFLKIGYSKRADGELKTKKGRPFIGRKGVGKLSFTAAANKIHIMSKTKDSEYIGALIDSKDMEQAIVRDKTTDEHTLKSPDEKLLNKHIENHKQGTIIAFEDLIGRKYSDDFIRRTIALYFKFSLLDKAFNIYLNDKLIDHNDLKNLADKTQFSWSLGDLQDGFIDITKPKKMGNLCDFRDKCNENNIKFFVASVGKPKDLGVYGGGDEKATLDVYVNGRVREINVLSKITAHQLYENYIYGQIHLDDLDSDDNDRFTTSREGIISDDELYNKKLHIIKKILRKISTDWTKFRNEIGEDGETEDENPDILIRNKARSVANAVAKKIKSNHDSYNIFNKRPFFKEDVVKYTAAYSQCYIVENLMRECILLNNIDFKEKRYNRDEIDKFKKREGNNKVKANIKYSVRGNCDTQYLGAENLCKTIANTQPKEDKTDLMGDIKKYSLVRDPLMHTSILTDRAFNVLTSTTDNLIAYTVSKLKKR